MDVGVQKYLAFVETADQGSFTRAAEKLRSEHESFKIFAAEYE